MSTAKVKVNMITDVQKKALWGAASAKGLSKEDLYAVIESVSGKERMTVMTYVEAAKVLDRINNKNSNVGEYVPGKISPGQMSMIHNLAITAGWNSEQLNSHIFKKFNVNAINWLSKKQASSLIETLKWLIKQKGSNDVKYQ